MKSERKRLTDRKEIVMNEKDKSHIYKSNTGEFKRCFCIGPENCEDETCLLVKQYREKQNVKES